MSPSIFTTSIFLLFFTTLNAQNTLPPYPEKWDSRWITHPEIEKTAHQVIHFRKKFNLSNVPDQFVIHVSGDNRYRLYVNEKEVSYGPQLGDIRNWRYETIDVAPYLNKGENIISVEVINWGIDRHYGIISSMTAFLLQGNSDKERAINTGSEGWKVEVNKGFHEKTVNWIMGIDIVGGFYAANPTDSIVADDYPWGWKKLTYDDSQWSNPEIIFARPKTNAGAGHGWILEPRTTALQSNIDEPVGNIVRHNLDHLDSDFAFEDSPLTLPPNSSKTILIDKGYVTLGYPKIELSGGDGARVRVQYAEALYDENNQKGHRNEIEGKVIKGMSDVYMMDGGQHRVFQPLWFRAFRFIQLEMETKNDPLVIENFHNVFSASPIEANASFQTTDKMYEQIWEICWRGLKICAQDNLISDAYYEQMQYVGDSRPHLMAWNSITGDLTYFRNAIEQFNNSRLPDGNITSCYPLKANFAHPTYSLIWIDMLHDLMMVQGDKKFISPYLGEIQEVFDYYETLINENDLVGDSEYLMFIDWYLPKGGNSQVNKKGNSAILTLNYAYSLRNAADIAQWLGKEELAEYYSRQAKKYATQVRKLCFDEVRGIYSDDPGKTFYDQRASILAVLAGAHSEQESKELMIKILDESTQFDSKANLFYYFYLFEAMSKTGAGDFRKALKPWEEMVNMGMSATPEKRMEQHPRSEVHPWASHPVHYYFEVVAGITPSSPGFKTVNIRPNLGDLKDLQITYPTINGPISLNLKKTAKKRLMGEVTLPGNMTGQFEWNSEHMVLKPGVNKINL